MSLNCYCATIGRNFFYLESSPSARIGRVGDDALAGRGGLVSAAEAAISVAPRTERVVLLARHPDRVPGASDRRMSAVADAHKTLCSGETSLPPTAATTTATPPRTTIAPIATARSVGDYLLHSRGSTARQIPPRCTGGLVAQLGSRILPPSWHGGDGWMGE